MHHFLACMQNKQTQRIHKGVICLNVHTKQSWMLERNTRTGVYASVSFSEAEKSFVFDQLSENGLTLPGWVDANELIPKISRNFLIFF